MVIVGAMLVAIKKLKRVQQLPAMEVVAVAVVELVSVRSITIRFGTGTSRGWMSFELLSVSVVSVSVLFSTSALLVSFSTSIGSS